MTDPKVVFRCDWVGTSLLSGPEKIILNSRGYFLEAGDGSLLAGPFGSLEAAIRGLTWGREVFCHWWEYGIRWETRITKVLQMVQGYFVRENAEDSSLEGPFETLKDAVEHLDLLCVSSETVEVSSRVYSEAALRRMILFDDSFDDGRWFRVNGRSWKPKERTIKARNRLWHQKRRRPILPKELTCPQEWYHLEC